MPNETTILPGLSSELAKLEKSCLYSAVKDIDNIINTLTTARSQIAQASESHTAGLTMTRLQNPVQKGFESVLDDLRGVQKAQKGLGKAIDKALPLRALPTETDVMADYLFLVNQAVLMHLLREGQFSVASTFLRESRQKPSADGLGQLEQEMASEHSKGLHAKFTDMYRIRSEIEMHNLAPAIEWASAHSKDLELKGSNLEFDLAKLQFVWLFHGPAVNGLPDDDENNGRMGALNYARRHLYHFRARNLKQIQELACAMVFPSPYTRLFDTTTAFEDIALLFTREFCSLLGLSAESPLYLAVTAGSIALPQLIKYTSMKSVKTEWSQANELPYETPLPKSMVYHPIFVCPVLKVQTDEQNPPMMLPCGHVICKESLQSLCRPTRFKCPYCPVEGHLKDAVRVEF